MLDSAPQLPAAALIQAFNQPTEDTMGQEKEVPPQIIDLFEALKAALHEQTEQNQKRTQEESEQDEEPSK